MPSKSKPERILVRTLEFLPNASDDRLCEINFAASNVPLGHGRRLTLAGEACTLSKFGHSGYPGPN